MSTIPVLSLNGFLSSDPQRQAGFVQAIGTALQEIGFFALVDHGIPQSLIRDAYQVSQQFFALPEAVKQQYEDPALKGQRGFTSFGREHAKDSPWPDLKEFWHLGRESVRSNLCPAEVPRFHPVLWQLYQQLDRCSAQLLQACALYLGEARSFFQAAIAEGDSIFRIIHYPPIPADAPPHSLRAAPHEDINLITLLCEATDSGLELLQRDGSWLAVPTQPGQIIVDSGDMLQWMTNGLLKSTTHRVVNPDRGTHPRRSPQPRFSMPFFAHPHPTLDLTPLPQCVAKTGDRPQYTAITAGDYLQQRLQEIGLA